MSKVRCLFVLKNQPDYSKGYGTKKSSGLRNSAQFVSDMLNANGIASRVVIVVDNNSIDREVSKFKATHVFIEALWVVPEKFDVLVKLHPNVKWIVRIHSEIPFLAEDGIAVDWIKKYVQHVNVSVAANSLRGQSDLEDAVGEAIEYLPNFYPMVFAPALPLAFPKQTVNIACFGAIRPLKNQLSQAIAAMQFANERGLELNFHINSDRVEHPGESILKNLRSLFANTKHNLIEHPWVEHPVFLQLIALMDLAMSVSFTETFSITTADAVSQAVPIVTSAEITWSNKKNQADPTNVDDIVEKIENALINRKRDILANQDGLEDFSEASQAIWLNFLGVAKKPNWLKKIITFGSS